MRPSILLRCFFVLAACGPLDDGTTTEEEFTWVSGDFFRGADGAVYVKTRLVSEDGDSVGAPVFRRTPVQDPASYRRLGDEQWYATDGLAVYWHLDTSVGTVIGVVEGADPATFEWTGYRTGRDATHRYDNGRIID